jgi:succinate dehydrogenase/fumarate reductase flavoprotein subunit
VVFAVGGPGGLYRTRVYPTVHTGAIGLALLAGARAQNLPESQFGLASTPFPWNVSGSYMQVVPRLVSTAADGHSDPQEFLRPYFPSAGEMHSLVFLKGYQWPFDSRKALGGSSLVDVLVYQETALRGRRVFLDFRHNPDDFAVERLSEEARTYLARSQALGATPLERLQAMNPGAIELYRDHGIDLAAEPLEIAVCAQHNNGGLAGNSWWESAGVSHLFPVGEVNGSHGVYRPGGAALNAGQVGGFRAAEYIAARYREPTLVQSALRDAAGKTLNGLLDWLAMAPRAQTTWQAERDEFQQRMTRDGAHIRLLASADMAAAAAWAQWARLSQSGCRFANAVEAGEALRTRQLCFAHAVYLDAIRFSVASGVGSRGSAVVLDPAGAKIHERLDDRWRIAPSNPTCSEQVLETEVLPDGRVAHRWVPRRPLPVCNDWFETAWARHRRGEIYDTVQ